MKILIVYITRHGCALKVAEKLSRKIQGQVELTDLREKQKINLDPFETVILGGSIHMGGIHRKLTAFCERYQRQLLQKRLGIFLCHMYQGDMAQKQFDQAFPQALRYHAVAHGLLGGEFEFEKMNFFEKMMVKNIAQTNHSISRIDDQAIDAFAEKINKN